MKEILNPEKIQLNFNSIDSGIQWQYPEPYTGQYLKDLLSSDEFVSNVDLSSSDINIVSRVCNYVSNLWQHDGLNEPGKSDPLFILSEAKKGKQFRCVEYSILLDGFLKALKISSRILFLKTSDAETRKTGAGHVVIEFYSRKYKKWIMADPQCSFIPLSFSIPLNTVELQAALTGSKEVDNFVNKETTGNLRDDLNTDYFHFIYPYLYYFSFRIVSKHNREIEQLMLVPEGVQMPAVFQINTKLNGLTATNNVNEFYKKPV